MEANVSSTSAAKLIEYPEVRKVFKDKIPLSILCNQEGDQILSNKIPIKFLSEFLLKG